MAAAGFLHDLNTALRCTCPRCHQGKLYPSFFDLRLHDKCAHCGLDLAGNDSADGPAVFLIFILGFLLVPLALWVDALFSPPLWVHAILWGIIALGATLASLKPIKAYILLLQHRHRPGEWQ